VHVAISFTARCSTSGASSAHLCVTYASHMRHPCVTSQPIDPESICRDRDINRGSILPTAIIDTANTHTLYVTSQSDEGSGLLCGRRATTIGYGEPVGDECALAVNGDNGQRCSPALAVLPGRGKPS
jgi:hypothetical protein